MLVRGRIIPSGLGQLILRHKKTLGGSIAAGLLAVSLRSVGHGEFRAVTPFFRTQTRGLTTVTSLLFPSTTVPSMSIKPPQPAPTWDHRPGEIGTLIKDLIAKDRLLMVNGLILDTLSKKTSHKKLNT